MERLEDDISLLTRELKRMARAGEGPEQVEKLKMTILKLTKQMEKLSKENKAHKVEERKVELYKRCINSTQKKSNANLQKLHKSQSLKGEVEKATMTMMEQN